MLPHQTRVRKIEGGDLRVGRLLIVIVEILAAAASDAHGRIEPEHLPREVESVDAVVAQLARAVVPGPVPAVMEAVRIEGVFPRASAPEVVVHAAGCRPVGVWAV